MVKIDLQLYHLDRYLVRGLKSGHSRRPYF